MTRNDTDWDSDLIDEQIADHLRQSREPDPLGKRALFSGSAVKPGRFGTLALECSSCKRESPVKVRELPGLAFPLTLTLPRRYHTFLKCPACGRRTWMRAHWRV
ncbi:MAG TPA: hypothetical protein VGB83_01285 [Actinomycetota bacterium]